MGDLYYHLFNISDPLMYKRAIDGYLVVGKSTVITNQNLTGLIGVLARRSTTFDNVTGIICLSVCRSYQLILSGAL